METKINIQSWIGAFLTGAFEPVADPRQDVRNQIAAGWYDWFCKDSSLARKTAKMGKIIARLKQGGKVDLKGCYVWFKNNCPLNGPLYDDFRFANIETGIVMFTTQIDCCWNLKRLTVYGRTPDGEGHWDKPLFETDSVKELTDWLNKPWEE